MFYHERKQQEILYTPRCWQKWVTTQEDPTSAKQVDPLPGSGTTRLTSFLNEWASSRVPIASRSTSDLPLPSRDIVFPQHARVLGSWGVDPEDECYIPGTPARLSLPSENPYISIHVGEMNRQQEIREKIRDISRERSTNVGGMNSSVHGAAVALRSPDIDYMHVPVRSMSPDFDFGTADFLSHPSLLVQNMLIKPRPITLIAFENKPIHISKLATGKIGGRRSEQRSVAHGYDGAGARHLRLLSNNKSTASRLNQNTTKRNFYDSVKYRFSCEVKVCLLFHTIVPSHWFDPSR
jgi:hypothetical protein